MSAPSNYGRKYFCVKVPSDISEDQEIYLHADRVEIKDGALIFYGKYYPDKANDELGFYEPDYQNSNGEEMPLLILNRDCWKVYYAASCLDGHAVAVVHWSSEIYERAS